MTFIPAQGGGKRFSLEQALVSVSARRAISELPLDGLDGKRAIVQIVVIADQGGGAIVSGGRPSASAIASNQLLKVGGFLGGVNQAVLGASISNSDAVYSKDLNLSVSDEQLLNNLIAIKLMQNNVLIFDGSKDSKQPDYYIQIIVDVFGIWRSRTDWGVKNKESLAATTSYEYSIVPLHATEVSRKRGRIGYDAHYDEKYTAWIGPGKFHITTNNSIFNQYLVDLGTQSKNTDAYKTTSSTSPSDKPPSNEKAQEIIIKN